MALYVNTNVSSLNAQRKLTNATNSLNTSYQRLASGFRINSAKDDAAGLQISDRLTAQINGLNQGNRNANDGIALAQTIEGALDETTTMLQRIRTLAVQAATGTNTSQDRQSLQEEVNELCQEITRIAEKTTFAGQDILNGTKSVNKLLNSSGQLFFQVGANAYDTLTLDLAGFAMSQIALQITLTANQVKYDAMTNSAGNAMGSAAINTANLLSVGLLTVAADGANGYIWSVSTAKTAQATLNNIDKFIQYVDSNRAALGAIQNRMESTIRSRLRRPCWLRPTSVLLLR